MYYNSHAVQPVNGENSVIIFVNAASAE